MSAWLRLLGKEDTGRLARLGEAQTITGSRCGMKGIGLRLLENLRRGRQS